MYRISETILFIILALVMLTSISPADTLIVPLPANSGYRVIELKQRPASTVQYEYIRVEKSTEEIRDEAYQREVKIRQNRWIQAQNRAGLYRLVRGRWERYYMPLEKIAPVSKWKYVKVRVAEQ